MKWYFSVLEGVFGDGHVKEDKLNLIVAILLVLFGSFVVGWYVLWLT